MCYVSSIPSSTRHIPFPRFRHIMTTLQSIKNLFSGKNSTSQISELATIKADNIKLSNELEQFKANKELVAQNNSVEIIKQSFQLEIDQLKKDFATKLSDKDKELEAARQDSAKQLEQVKGSVVEESIRLVASQGTNVLIESNVDSISREQALANFKQLQGKEALEFYKKHSSLLNGDK